MDEQLYWFGQVTTDPQGVFYEPPSAEKNMAILAAAAMSEDTKPVRGWKRLVWKVRTFLKGLRS